MARGWAHPERDHMKLRPTCLVLVVLCAGAMVGGAPVAAAAGSSYTWVGSSLVPAADNHSWSDARNWSPQGVPGNGDSVSVHAPGPSICAAHVDGIPAVTLASFSLTETASLCTVSVAGGPITVTGTFTWDSGTLDAPLTLAAGSVATLTGTQGRLKQATKNIEVNGLLQLTGVTGASAFKIDDPRVVHIGPGGELRSNGTNDITFSACCVTPARVVNDGTVRVTGVGAVLRITAVQFDQRKVLLVGSGAKLITTNAPVTAANGATYSGGGVWNIGNQSVARFSGAQTVNAPFGLVLGGEPANPGGRLGGSFSLGGTGRLDWTAGRIEGTVNVGRTFTVHAYGPNSVSAPRQLSGIDYTGATGVPARFENHGTFVTDPLVSIGTGGRAQLLNAPGGILRLAPGTRISSGGCCVSPDRITNQGGAVVVGSSSIAGATVLSNVSYSSTGGSTTIAPGEQLQLTGGAPGGFSSTTIAGGGQLLLVAPTKVAGVVTVGSATRVLLGAHGSIDGNATVAGAGRLGWTGGAFSGSVTVSTTGGVVIYPTAPKSLSNVNGGSTPSQLRITAPTTFASGTVAVPNTVNLGSSRLTLAGPSTVGNQVQIYSGTLVNTGSLTVNPGAGGKVDRTGSGELVNTGRLTLRSGTLTLGGLYRQNAGITDVQHGTSLVGQYSFSTVALSAGMLTGAGIVKTSVSNGAGTVSPGASDGTAIGTLRITGNYVQHGGSRVIFDLARTTRDRLTVDHSSTLLGTLVFRTTGSPVPAVGSSATPLTTGTGLTGTAGCAYTTGPGSTTGHWAHARGSRNLVVVRRTGADTHC